MDSFPSFTRRWHNDTYDSINPTTRKELSLTGKVVVISGGGRGIGRGMSNAFAEAGASSIVLLGRQQSSLDETKQEVETKYANVQVSTYAVDVVDLDSVKQSAQAIGNWDVLISNAGFLPSRGRIADSSPDDWWKGFEINVKGTFNLLHAFLPKRNQNSVAIGVNAGSIQIPGDHGAQFSSYNGSKLAALKIFQTLAAEYPDIHVVSYHPGVVETDMMKSSGMGTPSLLDTLALPSHFAVWLCSQEANFLRGRFVWTNWDVDELKAKSKEIEGDPLLLTTNILGFPYPFPAGNLNP